MSFLASKKIPGERQDRKKVAAVRELYSGRKEGKGREAAQGIDEEERREGRGREG